MFLNELREVILKMSIDKLECISRTVVQICLVVGFIWLAIKLEESMDSFVLMRLSKSYDDCVEKASVMTNRLEVVYNHLQGYSRQMDEVMKRIGNMESRLHVTTNLMQECSMRMNTMTNGLDKVESMLRKMEQRSYVLKIEGCCNCWCPCCLWKVGCQ